MELLEPRPRLAPPLRENLGVDVNLYTVLIVLLIVLLIVALIIWIVRSL
jgi:flagellar biogenesis protein FliO